MGDATSSRAYYKKEEGVKEKEDRKVKYPKSERKKTIIARRIHAREAFKKELNKKELLAELNACEETLEEWIEREGNYYNNAELERQAKEDAEWKKWAEERNK